MEDDAPAAAAPPRRLRVVPGDGDAVALENKVVACSPTSSSVSDSEGSRGPAPRDVAVAHATPPRPARPRARAQPPGESPREPPLPREAGSLTSRSGACATSAHARTGVPAVPGAAAPATYSTPDAAAALSWRVVLFAYWTYAVLIVLGTLRDAAGKLLRHSSCSGTRSHRPGFAPLMDSWESFFTRRMYARVSDCWNRMIASAPTVQHLRVVERPAASGPFSTLAPTSTVRDCYNLGSYNYLGVADDWHSTFSRQVLPVTAAWPLSETTAWTEGGYTSLHQQLEHEMAAFVGKPAAIIFSMGFGTNVSGLPALAGKGCLIISDSLNHVSIVAGARSSGATIRVFKHNDYDGLEAQVRKAIVDGQDRTHRPWRKIIIAVEGVYSMEGDVIDLRRVVAIAKAYKAYVYLDEAHSIGAMGRTGRGVCEHCGVDPADVDIMMGTFTKSFGAMGGYIAASQEVVDYLRANAASWTHATAMSPTVCQQVLAVLNVITGADGTDIGATKLRALRENSNYLRKRLAAVGFTTLGAPDSPVIPVMIAHPCLVSAFSRECLERNLAVVIVGFPATPLLLSRARFCVSAGMSRQQLDDVVDIVEDVGRTLCLL